MSSPDQFFEKSLQETIQYMVKEHPEMTLEELINKYFNFLFNKIGNKLQDNLAQIENSTQTMIDEANQIYLKSYDDVLKAEKIPQ